MEKTLFTGLQKAYRCRIYGLKARRNVYIAKTDRGVWIIKGYRQREKAEWVTQLSDQLFDNGFYHTVHYVTHSGGQKVLPLGNRYYTVMKEIPGREASFVTLTDVRKAATALARFHLAAEGFPASHEMLAGKIPLLDKWEDRIRYFEKITAAIARRGPQNRLEQVILAMAKETRENSWDVLNHAGALPLKAEMDQAVTKGTLAHRDLASHNFLIDAEGVSYLIDLDTVASDMQLVDLVQFFGRMLLLQGYAVSAFQEAMEAYTKLKPLSDSQIWTIHQLLRFPDNFLREVAGLYARRSGFMLRGVSQLVMLERSLRQARERFLRAEAEIFGHPAWENYRIIG
ncbi:phosphotransferase [Brevibacillus fulvus]|uniref:CotS family spore coat protein n=1 Tax=Brevibacillus fulvus TaxID=1125967 RepID=A0A939BRT9_9BACL|nr:phosphotransferase [Brevibacillus fulvus]MBM7589997.1 CotS family spore coat protein [Brevibacillus fulvus]